jgi:hypothetical protein
MRKVIMYSGQELDFQIEVLTCCEAQDLLDYERSQGRVACATHYDGRHQIYSAEMSPENKAYWGRS